MNKETSRKKSVLSKAWNVLFFAGLIFFVFSTDAKSWVLRQLVTLGLFNAKMEKVDTARGSSPGGHSFSFNDAGGVVRSAADLKGKVVFINFWATWCPPCRAEMPSIQKLAQSVDSNKVAFVLLALDDDFSKSKSFVQKQKLSLPIYYPGENLPELFNVQGIPTTFIFNEKGALIGRIDGGDDYDTEQYRKILQ